MNRNFTRSNSMKEQNNEACKIRTIRFGPREKTLDFILQFARAYHFEPALKHNLGSFIVN